MVSIRCMQISFKSKFRHLSQLLLNKLKIAGPLGFLAPSLPQYLFLSRWSEVHTGFIHIEFQTSILIIKEVKIWGRGSPPPPSPLKLQFFSQPMVWGTYQVSFIPNFRLLSQLFMLKIGDPHSGTPIFEFIIYFSSHAYWVI